MQKSITESISNALQREERDILSEAVVSLRTLVTFVTWLIQVSRTEFSSSELVL